MLVRNEERKTDTHMCVSMVSELCIPHGCANQESCKLVVCVCLSNMGLFLSNAGVNVHERYRQVGVSKVSKL